MAEIARITFLMGCMVGILAIGETRADEPVEKFLEALRDNGYFDVALDYLEVVDKRNLADESFRRTLPFEKAEVLIASVRSVRDPKLADARLNEAQQILARFSGTGASLEELSRVANYQGNLFLNRARVSQMLGENDRLTAPERETFAKQAREMLANAYTNYSEAKKLLRELIDPRSPNGLKIDPQDPSTTDKLKRYQGIYVNVRLNLATTIEQLADSFEPSDPKYREYLSEAAKEYKSHHEDYYRTHLAAWTSRVYEARCYQKLGNHKEALTTLEEVFDKTGGAFVNLRRLAFQLACDSWSELEVYPAEEIVARLEPLVEGLNRTEAQMPNWLRVQLELAIALYQKSEQVRQQPGNRSRSDSEAIRRKAGRFLRNVAKFASPHRDQARQLLTEWNIPMSEPKTAEENLAANSFDGARQLAKDKVAEIEDLVNELRLARAQLAEAKGAAAEPLVETVEELDQRLIQWTDATLEMINTAMGLADEDTTPADINQLRYLQSYSYYSSERFIESAVIGEFMLNKYPAIDPTRQAMNFLIQSYVRMYAQQPENNRAFERNRLSSVGLAVIERWPGSDEAARAAASLINLALADKDFQQAHALFRHIPESFPGLAQLAAQFGARLWIDYRERSVSAPAGDADNLNAQRQQAKDYLEQAVKLSSPSNLIYDTALASRFLVDVYLDLGEFNQALAALESNEIAPLDLVKQKHPVVFSGAQSEAYIRDTYRLALRVYIATLKNTDSSQAAIEKMKGVLAAMRQQAEASNRPEDQRQLSQIYGLIANEILAQYESQPVPEKSSFAGNLMGFLSSIERESSDAETILWAGSTALRVAKSVTELGLGDDSKAMFQQAVSALSRAEEIGFANNPQREALLIELKRQRALALRGEQKFEEAINQFNTILDSAPQNLKVQLDAAETLQIWGVSTKRARLLAEAIKGTNRKLNPQTKREANQIWGWEFLAKAARGKNDELFAQAIYHWAECLLENGLIENDSNRIATALKLIETEESRPPGLNHSYWKPKLESLKQRIKTTQ